jgi:cytosolic carboxypeptidase protein 2/3
MKDPVRSKFVERSTLFTTLAGNKGELLTITDPSGTEAEQAKKKGVIITARIHPGESNSSFMMKGVINFLTQSDSLEANLLRKTFVFKIVPMINVDGVICGNYRASLSGMDLNRQWKAPSSVVFPEIHAIKRMAKNF